MATTARTKDGGLGKEYKRGTSPSNSQTSQRISSRQQASSNDDKEKTSEKNIPNYLKPTISSRINEPLKQLGNKKNINTSHDQDKQKLLRRRSFDKPPSASPRAQKSLVSFDRAAAAPLVPRERKMPVRSSSLGTHTVTTTKTPRALKAVSSLPAVGSKPTKMKSSPSLIVNKEESCNINASASKKSTSCCDHEANKQEDLVREVEEEVINKAVEGETSTEDKKILNSCDISACVSEDQILIQESRVDDDDQVKADRDEKEKINKEETGGDSSVPEDSEDHENVNGSSEDDDNTINVEEEREKREEAAASEGLNQAKEEEEAKVVSEGKKESPSSAYYNDVIEETATKLLEKRKNKVRALVGAFETVIDYESAASSK